MESIASKRLPGFERVGATGAGEDALLDSMNAWSLLGIHDSSVRARLVECGATYCFGELALDIGRSSQHTLKNGND